MSLDSENNKYNLVHFISSSEYNTPLLASQVFDRAQVEATIDGNGKPNSVSVWLMIPMRKMYTKETSLLTKSLKKRCPDIQIKLIGGIGRFNWWPAPWELMRLRKALKSKTIYHCRGEASVRWISSLKKAFPGDPVIFDVRGYWPLEKLGERDVFNEKDMYPDQKQPYENDVRNLREKIKAADWVCTVSETLREYLIDRVGAREDTVIIPCCVKNVIPDTNRERIRQELNIQDKIAILYLGGTQKGQYLENLTLPFMKSALSVSDKYVGVFITQHKDSMAALLTKFQIDPSKTRLISVAQNEVAPYLSAMDMGLLLKSPTDINNTSQPTKFGEYLSAGIPVILEEGTGKIADILNQYKIGCVIKLTGKTEKVAFDNEVKKALDWFELNKDEVREKTKKYTEERYTWKANLPIERNMYLQAIQRVNQKERE